MLLFIKDKSIYIHSFHQREQRNTNADNIYIEEQCKSFSPGVYFT